MSFSCFAIVVFLEIYGCEVNEKICQFVGCFSFSDLRTAVRCWRITQRYTAVFKANNRFSSCVFYFLPFFIFEAGNFSYACVFCYFCKKRISEWKFY
jgi:hypothetical protein